MKRKENLFLWYIPESDRPSSFFSPRIICLAETSEGEANGFAGRKAEKDQKPIHIGTRMCERVRMSSVVNRHPLAWGNRWREWKSPFWSPSYPWHPFSSIPPSHLSLHLLPCALLHLYLCLFQQTLSLCAIPWTSLSSRSTRHLSDAALVTSIHPAPSAPLTISPVVSGSLASRAISQTHTNTHARFWSLIPLSSPPTSNYCHVIRPHRFLHGHFYTVDWTILNYVLFLLPNRDNGYKKHLERGGPPKKKLERWLYQLSVYHDQSRPVKVCTASKVR